MENLEKIWTQLNDISLDLKEVIQEEADNSIFKQLEKEEQLRKKYNPFLFSLIALIPLVFWGLLHQNMDWTKALGIACITGSGVAIATFSQIVKIPLQQFQYDQSSLDFMSIVKQKLDQSRMMLVIGVLLQVLLLGTGLYLLIFSNTPLDNLLLFSGIMMSLCGLVIGLNIASFNRHYRDIYQKIARFLEEDEENWLI